MTNTFMLLITFCKSSPFASFQPFPVKQDVLPLPPREMSKNPSLYVFTGCPQHGDTWKVVDALYIMCRLRSKS